MSPRTEKVKVMQLIDLDILRRSLHLSMRFHACHCHSAFDVWPSPAAADTIVCIFLLVCIVENDHACRLSRSNDAQMTFRCSQRSSADTRDSRGRHDLLNETQQKAAATLRHLVSRQETMAHLVLHHYSSDVEGNLLSMPMKHASLARTARR